MIGSRSGFLVLAAACVLLLIEATTLIGTRWVEDESWIASGSWTFAQEGRIRTAIFPSEPSYEIAVGPPVYTVTEAYWFGAFGLGIPQARLLSALDGLFTLVVVFYLGREIGGTLCGAVAAVIAASDTFLVVAARTARPEAETMLLSWLAILLYFLGVRRESPILALASGAVCGLGLLCHPLAMPFFGSLCLFFVMQYGLKLWRGRLFWMFTLGVSALMIPYLLYCFSDAAHVASFRRTYMDKVAEPIHIRIVGELDRWRDFVGLTNQRLVLPVRIPARIHVPLILAAAFAFLFRKQRRLGVPMLILLVTNLLWFVYLVNKGPRYFAMLAPLFALVLGYLVCETQGRRGHRLAVAAVVLVFLTQIAGNTYWVYQSRRANYPEVARQLRQIVPPGSSVYAATTFWMALHDRTYYAYDRTPFDFAIAKLHPEYLVLNDRVMAQGSGHGADDFAGLRAQTAEFIRGGHATLAGQVSNSFYGDLEVYRVSY